MCIFAYCKKVFAYIVYITNRMNSSEIIAITRIFKSLEKRLRSCNFVPSSPPQVNCIECKRVLCDPFKTNTTSTLQEICSYLILYHGEYQISLLSEVRRSFDASRTEHHARATDAHFTHDNSFRRQCRWPGGGVRGEYGCGVYGDTQAYYVSECSVLATRCVSV